MGKLVMTVVIGLAVVLAFYMVKDSRNQRKITAIETENNALRGKIVFMEKKIEKDYQTTLAISERNKELEKAAKIDKKFDWTADISHSPVIKRLQAN